MKSKKASIVALIFGLDACGAFIPGLISRRGALLQRSPRSIGPPWATPTDAVDAMPSDVTPEFESTPPGNAAASASEPEFSLADDLLQIISSGVGEGYIPYSDADKSAIEELVVELESSGEGTKVQFPRDLSKLDGRWRLMFTNNLVGLGKLSPLTLRDVFQVVNTSSGVLTNVAYGDVSPPLFAETWGRLGQRVGSLAKSVEERISFPVDFDIEHKFDVSSQSMPAQIELVQKELKLLNVEDPSKRSVALPALRPLAKAAAGRFDTTFLGKDVRVSRGRFGEIRVFQRVA